MKSFSKQLTEDMADLLFGSLKMYSNYSDIKRRLEDFFAKVTCDDIDVPIEEFLDLYDMRAYNFDSKRADIKVLKNYKFKGAYALYNVDKNFYYTGFSNDIFRKIDRHFRGYGNIRLYEEWQNGDNFVVKMSFCDEDNDDPEELQKDLDEYFEKRRISVEDRLEEQRLEEERIQAQKRVTREKRKRFFNFHRKLFFALIILLAITFAAGYGYNVYKNYLTIKYTKDELIGVPYDSVKTKLTMAGFTNINYSDIEDLKLKESDKEGIVTNIFIDGKYFDFENKHKVYSNKNIVIEYHTLERIVFPYSSKTIIGKDYKEVVKLLKKRGFSNIACKPKKDLIIGLLNHKNEISKVSIVNHNKFTKKTKIKPNDQITIVYHSFKK